MGSINQPRNGTGMDEVAVLAIVATIMVASHGSLMMFMSVVHQAVIHVASAMSAMGPLIP
jgi:hypothetical protein